MGQRIIITEEEKKNILSLYEQTDDLYKKENDFLKRYVGKTINAYADPNLKKIAYQLLIVELKYLKYDAGEAIRVEYDWPAELKTQYPYSASPEKPAFPLYIKCMYNPSKFSYELSRSWGQLKYDNYYNKTLVDDIMSKGTAAGIQWCKKPQADFGMNNSPTDLDKTV
jgi:hypothetical protein